MTNLEVLGSVGSSLTLKNRIIAGVSSRANLVLITALFLLENPCFFSCFQVVLPPALSTFLIRTDPLW